MPRLVLHAGTPQARGFELKPGSNYVGRGFANDLHIEDPSVSSNHARIIVEGEVITVKDLGSTNGTFIDRSQVMEGFLQPGQLLQLGGVELLLETEAASQTDAPPVPSPAAPVNGVRYTATVVARAPTASPPIPPPVSSGRAAPPAAAKFVESPTGKTTCKFHPKSPARWLCGKCGQIYCDLCVNSRIAPGGAKSFFCRPCGGECTPVAYKPKLNALLAGNFFRLLPTAFAYPFKNERKYILIGAIVCYNIMFIIRSYIPLFYGRGIITVLFFGYWYSYLQSIIHTTAYGDDTEPSLPEASWSDLVTPVFQMFAGTALCFLLPVVLMIWGFFSPDAETATFMLISVPLCCLYYPMALLSMSVSDSVSGVNPLVVIPAIIKTPVHYLLACVVFGVVIGFYFIGHTFLPLIIPIPYVPTAISSVFWLYFMMVLSRVLGLLYYYNRHRLGWIRHHH
jgi:hypothetical protein